MSVTSPEVFTTTEVLTRIPGLTFRKLDYWIRKGYVRTVDDVDGFVGSGNTRWSAAAVAQRLDALRNPQEEPHAH